MSCPRNARRSTSRYARSSAIADAETCWISMGPAGMPISRSSACRGWAPARRPRSRDHSLWLSGPSLQREQPLDDVVDLLVGQHALELLHHDARLEGGRVADPLGEVLLVHRREHARDVLLARDVREVGPDLARRRRPLHRVTAGARTGEERLTAGLGLGVA